ncbi:cinnamoyl-CoA reductase 1-like isoform X3 [Punica granatum]|uniref:Cinnamoyl-CoA reductase 1-like isoform X3 n=1 Tax=Punica granatum TaxID=22663 RepID=A0A6P8ECX6_PUNGR|nr:cinnamoyl-CoA reductase 1-like isoform X3 [Punica granatum]
MYISTYKNDTKYVPKKKKNDTKKEIESKMGKTVPFQPHWRSFMRTKCNLNVWHNKCNLNGKRIKGFTVAPDALSLRRIENENGDGDGVEKKRACVTGAGGFIASWIVKLLLSKDYIVHGTVRDPEDKKYAHLNKLDGAPDNPKLFKADLLDYDSLLPAIAGCAGVIHVACPVPTSALAKPEVEMLEPSMKGTLNVLRACTEAKVKRVVHISSTAAVVKNHKWPEDWVKDETCWSDKEYCRATENWYLLAKTEAESIAFEYGKQNGLDVVAVNPGWMQSILNFSTLLLLKFVKGVYIQIEPDKFHFHSQTITKRDLERKLRENYGENCRNGNIQFLMFDVRGTYRCDVDGVPNKLWVVVDVRDAADAVLLAFEKPESEGRYICVAYNIMIKDLAEKLKSLYPDQTCLEK